MTTIQATDAGIAPNADTVLHMNRTFAAPPERVFAAFTDPEILKAWWGPDGFDTPVAEIDPRPGGTYYIQMRSPDGDIHDLRGVYREVDPPRRLVMTWTWQQGTLEGMETLVTLDFRDVGGRTEVVLTHELPTPKAVEMHGEGWGGGFDHLERYLAG